jgi:hypothetical protein
MHTCNKVNTFSIASEFLVRNAPLTNIYYAKSELGSYSFIYTFIPIGKETYIYLFYIPDSSQKNDYLVSTVYNREKGEWKLQSITTGYITNNKLIAPYIFEKAKEYWYAGNMIPAAFYALLSSKLAIPAGNNFHYTIEKEMLVYDKAILDSVNTLIKLPKTIDEIPTKPVMMGLAPELINGNLYKLITYNSRFQLSDTTSINAENEKVHKIISKIFPNINEIDCGIQYRVFSNFDTKVYYDITR